MEYYNDFEDLENLPRIKNMPIDRPSRPWKIRAAKKLDESQRNLISSLEEQRDDVIDYDFSYDASRHEREWIMDSLVLFFEMQWFSDVVRLVKGGKEASVYQCLTSPASPAEEKYLAAKVYRPRRFRNLRNDYIYREGRAELDDSGNEIIDEGMLKAIQQRSDYGRQVMHTSWLEHEFNTMKLFSDAGADVPRPYARGNNAILMEFIGDGDMAAPTLNAVELDQVEARILFERVLFNIEIMLANERVHADLSAFNILYWQGDIMLIDFPQAISPFENRNAYSIFKRDLRRVCEYFTRQGVEVKDHELARKLWQSHKYRRMPEIHPGLLDEEDEQDREYWDRLIYKT